MLLWGWRWRLIERKCADHSVLLILFVSWEKFVINTILWILPFVGSVFSGTFFSVSNLLFFSFLSNSCFSHSILDCRFFSLFNSQIHFIHFPEDFQLHRIFILVHVIQVRIGCSTSLFIFNDFGAMVIVSAKIFV